MKTKIIAMITAVLLLANTVNLTVVDAKGPSTSSRSGSFSTGSKSSGTINKTAPSQSNSGSSSGFSGGSSSKSNTPSMSNSGSTSGSATNSTGYQRPSSNVTSGSTVNPTTGKTYYNKSTYQSSVPTGSRSSSMWPMVGAFAAGTFLGSMLHPWGGYYGNASMGYVHQPFSFFSMLLDIILLIAIIAIVMKVFRSFRRRSY
ncbi:hypothetical protein [Paenibacillus aestuarii]|uniref:Uncharacterized protein n=1 Tax=Paenibacillus aestuarii TaxID=516965 RepID=A0ABW0KDM0_9BACL|nr:hypothetical protein [Paenibacillus aestuarii]